METFNRSMIEYRKQLERGIINEAYKGLMEYIMSLRTHLDKKYPDFIISGSIYFGYMDMTYFSFTPISLNQRKLKVAFVFNHATFQFEVWLAGHNKQVQSKYWKYFKEKGWEKYHIVSSTKGVDSIVEHTLVENPDFSDLNSLTNQIEGEGLKFIGDVEHFLIKNSI